MRVGLIGLGRMGSAIAERLGEVGIVVTGWDIDPARGAGGIVRAGSPGEVAARSDVIASIITEDGGVRGLWHGAGGFDGTDITGKLFIEMSTLQPATIRALAAHAAGRGAVYLDSPVLGSIPTARAGQLTALVGGDDASVARARALLEHLTAKIEHIGPTGSGAVMKLVINNMMGSYLQILSESLMLGESQGLSLERMIGVIGESINASPWFQFKRPALLGQDSPMTLDVRTLRKDLLAVAATAAAAGVPTPVAVTTAASLSSAVQAGLGGQDCSALVAFLRAEMPQRW